MDDTEKKPLTSTDNEGIILNRNEKRILNNLRKEANRIQFGEFTVQFTVHERGIKKGIVRWIDTKSYI